MTFCRQTKLCFDLQTRLTFFVRGMYSPWDEMKIVSSINNNCYEKACQFPFMEKTFLTHPLMYETSNWANPSMKYPFHLSFMINQKLCGMSITKLQKLRYHAGFSPPTAKFHNIKIFTYDRLVWFYGIMQHVYCKRICQFVFGKSGVKQHLKVKKMEVSTPMGRPPNGGNCPLHQMQVNPPTH